MAKRCKQPSVMFSTANGYRLCADHVSTESDKSKFEYADCGPCDYALDNMGAASYSKRMRRNITIAKAKLYRTARISGNSDCFQCGDYVAVEYIGRGSFGLNFRCTLGEFVEVLNEYELTDFVL